MKLKISYNSPVVLSFVIVCGIVLLVNTLTAGAANKILALRQPFSYQLLTYIFAHADMAHLTGNMTLMLLVGPVVEEKYGSKRLLLMIFTTAVITGLLSALIFHTGLIGASGIVFMMIVLSAFTNIKAGKIPLTLILVVVCYLGNEVISGLFSQDDVSQFGHIAGGVLGLVWGAIFMYGKKPPASEQ